MFSTIQQNFQSFAKMLPSFSRVMELQRQCEEAIESKTQRDEKFVFRDGIRVEKVLSAMTVMPWLSATLIYLSRRAERSNLKAQG